MEIQFGKWLSVDEFLPECLEKNAVESEDEDGNVVTLTESDPVLIFVQHKGKGYVDYGSFDSEGEWWEGDFGDVIPADGEKKVTHWMPLPAPPQEYLDSVATIKPEAKSSKTTKNTKK